MNQTATREQCECAKAILQTAEFKRCAYYLHGDVMIRTKDCSYWSEMINPWLNIFWENHRPWYKPWKKCVGFSLYCPLTLGFTSETPVSDIIDRVVEIASPEHAFGKYQPVMYKLARNLTVHIPL